VKLFFSCMQSVGKIVPSIRSKNRIDEFHSHGLHLAIAVLCPWLVKQHDECKQGLISISQKCVFVCLNTTNSDIQQVLLVARYDCAQFFDKLDEAFAWYKVLM